MIDDIIFFGKWLFIVGTAVFIFYKTVTFSFEEKN